jgi:hypothetical protein
MNRAPGGFERSIRVGNVKKSGRLVADRLFRHDFRQRQDPNLPT